ncbi:MAG: AAA family ATPase [Proteobacteria bacterium]|nr:AAA family ATPase [Pseudomonadota bacterium]
MKVDAAQFQSNDRYELIRVLGEGGNGVVYEARDRRDGGLVALKALRKINPQAIFLFKKEFRSLQDLRHRNLISLGELFEANGNWFFSMELIRGGDFLRHVRGPALFEQPARQRRVRHLDLALEQTEPSIGKLDGVAVTSPSGSPPDHADPRPIRRQARAVHGSKRSAGDDAIGDNPTGYPGAGYDEARLRAALGQLSAGLCALHRAGKVHRDIKPSNILVADDGRLILLDFGLTTEFTAGSHDRDGHIVGTVAYMAPEQARGERIGPAADWYSVGTVLYQALTGRLPFQGGIAEVLRDKQSQPVPDPRGWGIRYPDDLVELCLALLHVSPRDRPTTDEMARLFGVRHDHRARAIVAQPERGLPLVGRERELAVLDAGLAQVASGQQVAIVIRGQSGVGKSALLSDFVARLGAREATTVLRGRCYEREAVPYKAFDGIVDALASTLRDMPKDVVAGLLPGDAGLLPRMFPVLGLVEAIVGGQTARAPTGDQRELRNRVFSSLRELLARLAEKSAIVVVIDDFQWTDVDSMDLLDELLRPPDPPPLLLLIARRTDIGNTASPRSSETGEPGYRELSSAVRHIDLEPLEPDDARRLAELLLQRLPGRTHGAPTDTIAADIAVEAGGHPLYIDELVKHTASANSAARTPQLDEAIWLRASQLDGEALQLLQLVAVAGTHMTEETIRAAAELDPAIFARHMALLRSVNLIRGTTDVRSAGPLVTIEPYHDRVREAVGSRLSSAERRGFHLRLAIALDQTATADQRPELLFRHLRGAGQIERAAVQAEKAAQAALDALAFDRAAELYRARLQLGHGDEVCVRALRLKLSNALIMAGRGAEAAAVLERAARGAGPEVQLHCRIEAAEQLLESGHMERGATLLRGLLAEYGIAYPASSGRAVLSIIYNNLRLDLDRVTWQAPSSRCNSTEQARATILLAATRGFLMIDSIRFAAFAARGLRLAAGIGDTERGGHFLLLVALSQIMAGSRFVPRARRLIDQASNLAERFDLPWLRGLVLFTRGTMACMGGHYRDSVQLYDAALAVFERLNVPMFEVNGVRFMRVYALWTMGEFADLRRSSTHCIRDACRRGDRCSEVLMRLVGSVQWLVDDQPEPLPGQLDAMQWMPHESGQHNQHWLELIARVNAALYTDDVTEMKRLQGILDQYGRLLIARSDLFRRYRIWLSGVLAVARARHGEAKELRRARRWARRLDRDDHPYTRVNGYCLRANIAQLVDTGDVAQWLDRAMAAAESADMRLHAAVTRRQLGLFLGSAEGDEMVARADAWMAKQGIRAPARMARIILPAFG